MKFLPLIFARTTQFLMLLATTAMVGESAILAPPSHAVTATTSFVCGKVDGTPATVARTKKGDVPILIWRAEDFSKSGFTPQVRCQRVSDRFQALYSSGQLRYITAGKLDKTPVLCATKEKTGICTKQNLLYTLRFGSDPQSVIKKLMEIRNRATSGGVDESGELSTSIEVNWLESDENQ
jgi:hypothetical protein